MVTYQGHNILFIYLFRIPQNSKKRRIKTGHSGMAGQRREINATYTFPKSTIHKLES